MGRCCSYSLFLWLCLLCGNGFAQVASTPIPKSLKPWVDWVLYDTQNIHCPIIYNAAKEHFCAWPSRLQLKLNRRGGRFSQNWVVYTDNWLALPGEKQSWPQDVRVNKRAVPVIARNERPYIYLKAGKYTVQGTFVWNGLPQSLNLPASVGLISLQIGKTKIDSPQISASGRLWLQEKRKKLEEQNKSEDKIQIRVYRKIDDDIPLYLTTHIQLQISGSQREELLSRVFPRGFIPADITSNIPARLEVDGTLRVQVRPGLWSVKMRARSPDMVKQITLEKPQLGLWPSEEVWVFQAYNQLRSVSLHGLSPLDPEQTSLPNEWRHLPSYRIEPGQSLKLDEQRRGDIESLPENLHLHRTLWLDFNGQGYTIRDKISGEVNRSWRLEMTPSLQLGHVSVAGRPRYITQLPKSTLTGVELRHGSLSVEAVSRKEKQIRALPVVAWDHDFQSVQAELKLPPAWLLVDASGVDEIETWLRKWNLLDLFLVMLICISIGKLWGNAWAALAALTLFLTYLDQDAPKWIWVHIILVVALMRVLPRGKMAKIAHIYSRIVYLALIIICLPYLADQIRQSLYPQLGEINQVTASPASFGYPAREKVFLENEPVDRMTNLVVDSLVKKSSVSMDKDQAGAQVFSEYDPDTTVQTGPGLPNWNWQNISLRWQGPVAKDQQMSLVLLPPPVTRILGMVKVLLLAILMVCVLNLRYRKGKGLQFVQISIISISCILGSNIFLVKAAEAQSLPNAQLLEELKKRLTRDPSCVPNCAISPRMSIAANSSRITIRQEIHAAESVAVPLPTQLDQWWPDSVLLNGKPAKALAKGKNNHLWIHLKQGVHQVTLIGNIRNRSLVNIPLPLKPHYLSVNIPKWDIEGFNNGHVEDSLQLKRKDMSLNNRNKESETFSLPPFLRVQRTLLLGVNWQVETRVTRWNKTNNPVIMEIPLLEGESVTSEGVRVVDDKVQLVMSANTKEVNWKSSLAPRRKLYLVAADTHSWIEIWRFKISPIWHADFSGLPVIQHKNTEHQWTPEWRPWPGESLKLAIDRPKGVSGDTITLDSSHLEVIPGKQATDNSLQLSIRSSRGGQHRVILPEKAILLSLRINNEKINVHIDKGIINLPIIPGTQRFDIRFREPDRGINHFYKSPVIDLSLASANAYSKMRIPKDRWVLFLGGPKFGPAVLLWGIILFILVVAFILGRLSLTPLGFGQWMLLGVGLTQISLLVSIIVIFWLVALGARKNIQAPELFNKWIFNFMQIGLVLLTVIALAALIFAVQQGLLGTPDMQIRGNGSSGFLLNWYQDHAQSLLPTSWVISVPMTVYRFLMLAWATWLALAMVYWLRWAWSCFSAGGFWHELWPRKIAMQKAVKNET